MMKIIASYLPGERGQQRGRRYSLIFGSLAIAALFAWLAGALLMSVTAGAAPERIADPISKSHPQDPSGGFAPPGANEPALAYNGTDGEYLVVWHEKFGDSPSGFNIYGQRVSDEGDLLGGEIAISRASSTQQSPAVAYNETNNEYLVVWHDYRNYASSGSDIYAQRVSGSGALLGGNFPVSAQAANEALPGVAYNAANNEHLVVWEAGGSSADIKGRRVSGSGALLGGEIAVATASGAQYEPDVAYSYVNNEYLVVWDDHRAADSHVYGRRVSNAGALLGGEIQVSTDLGYQRESSVAYDGTVNEYLVVWGQYYWGGSGNSDIYGQRVSGGGTLQGGNFAISNAPGAQSTPAVSYAFFALIGEYLVTWSDSRAGGDSNIYGQRVSSAGALVGGEFPISTAPGDQYRPAIAYYGDDREYLVVWQDLRDATLGEIYGQRVSNEGALLGGNFPISVAGVTCSIEFSDVPEGSTFHPYIMCLACRDILGGYPGGTFRPQNQITRGQIAKIVSNSAGYTDDVTGMQTYADVPSTQTFHEWIERLSMRGHMGGYNCGGVGETCDSASRPYFRPGNNATRGQLSKIVSNAAGLVDPPTGQTFEDVPTSSPFYPYIERLTMRGVMSGYPCGGAGEPCREGNRPYFRPGDNVTRGQAAKIVANTFFPECSAP